MRLIPGSSGIFIDESFDLHGDSELYHEKIKGESKDKVEIILQDTIQSVTRLWLFLYAWFETPIEVPCKYVYFFKLPYLDSKFPYHAYWRYALYAKPGYRVIPIAPRNAINEFGKVISCISGEERFSNNKDAYSKISVYFPPLMRSKTMRLHRLVANAWILKNQNEHHPNINHIDGNTKNNHRANLEWCSYQENSIHAFKTGLNPIAVGCRIRDAFTHTVTSFDSIHEAASFMGIPLSFLEYNQTKRRTPLIADRYEFRYATDNTPWLYSDNMTIMSTEKSQYQINIVDPKTNNVLVFNGIRSVKSYYHIWKKDGKALQEAHDVAEELRKRLPDKIVQLIDRMPESRVQIKNIITGKVVVYNNATDAGRKLQLPVSMISKFAKLDATHQYYDFLIRYYSKKSWPAKWVEPKAKHPVEVFDKETQIHYKFESLEEASRKLGISLSIVQKNLNKTLPKSRYMVKSLRKFSI